MKIALKTIFTALLLLVMSNMILAQSKANKQYELKAFHLAIKSYIRYINQNPSDGAAMAKLANCYRHLNQMQEAMEWYERAMSTPNDIDAMHNLYYGKVLMANGSYDRAMDQFRRYAQIDEEIGRHFIDKANYAKAQRNNRSPYQVANMASINTSASEFGPTFYQDKQIVFSSARTDAVSASDLRAGAKNWLFLAEEKPSSLIEPTTIINKDRKKKHSEGPVSYSADGRLVAITRNNFVDGKRHLASSGMKLDLYFAQVSADGGWANAEPFPYNDPEYSTGFAQLAADGNTLYFASDRPDANQIGGFDIYVSFRTGETWSTPENLGPIINTPGDEITPYFDGRNLYFASDWHPGLGGYDIFRSEKVSGQWSRTTHLGAGVNSSRDDYGFIYDGILNKGYFVSNRERGNGVEDIYSVTQAFEEIVLRVVNASDKSPISEATVDFVACNLSSYTTNEKGIYSFPLQEGMNCPVLIRKEGYLTASLELSDASLRAKKSYEIAMRREGEDYSGNIIDGVSRIPISNVHVRATNPQTEHFVEAISNEDGEYTLALSPNTMYIIRYSKAGYTDMNRTMPTSNGADRALLGTFPMQRTGSNESIAPVEDMPLIRDEISGESMPIPEAPARPDQPRYEDDVVIRPSTPSTPSYPNTDVITGPVYAVQIAAVKELQQTEFDHLESEFGKVYYVQSFDLNKVRVGPYPDKLEAARIMRKLQYRGFKGAFIVEEAASSTEDIVMLSPDAIDPDSDFRARTVVGNDALIQGGYKIRLGSYLKPKQSFRDSKIKQYGIVEKRIKEQWTIMLLGGFTSAADAKGVLGRVRSAGFKDAFVVEELANGELQKVR